MRQELRVPAHQEALPCLDDCPVLHKLLLIGLLGKLLNHQRLVALVLPPQSVCGEDNQCPEEEPFKDSAVFENKVEQRLPFRALHGHANDRAL